MSLKDFNQDELSGKLDEDAASIIIYREGLSSILGHIDSNPAVFAPDSGCFPTRSHKEDLWTTWRSYLDYHLALESLRQFYCDYRDIDVRPLQSRAFRVLYAAFLAQYRYALEFLEKTSRHHMADGILNDAVPEVDLPSGTFADFKFRYLNLLRAGEYAALRLIDRTVEGAQGELDPGIREDASIIWKMGKGKGEAMTLRNAVKVIKNNAFKAWFPVQAGVSQFMGDVRLRRQSTFLIKPEQVRELVPELRPGDIILTRREWFLSNVGLPGFWSHAALYIGTADERAEFFNTVAVEGWPGGRAGKFHGFEDLLKARYPEAYDLFSERDGAGFPKRVIEALGEGVIFTTAERALGADSVAVLRPRLPRTGKAFAIFRAFHYSGRPYDFNFNFTTDSALVCSELIYKSYEAAEGDKGLVLPLIRIAGRSVTPPNNIARLFDEECEKTRQQLEFVAFLDGFEGAGTAVRSGEEEFRRSWKRPNWHILVQGEPGE